MNTKLESFRAGLFPEQTEQFEKWLNSPEGRQTIHDTLKSIQKTIIEMQKAREIPLHLLHVPMDV